MRDETLTEGESDGKRTRTACRNGRRSARIRAGTVSKHGGTLPKFDGALPQIEGTLTKNINDTHKENS